jgi:divalent metal cation (Fe/Co/Zn/Cd) transporter
VVGGIVIQSALVGGRLALLGFGADAVIDAAASVALIWRFRIESREPVRAERVEHAAERVLGMALLALGAYLVAGAVRSLATQSHPGGSDAGALLLLASLVVLPPLAAAKYITASRLSSRAMRADSLLTGAAAILAAFSAASLVATASLGWWWADASAALVIAVVAIREGWKGLSLAGAA